MSANNNDSKRFSGQQDLWVFLKDTFRLVKPFWTGPDKVSAWFFIASYFVLLYGIVWLTKFTSYAYADMWDALSEQSPGLGSALLIYAGAEVIFILLVFVNQILLGFWELFWRRFLTLRFTQRYTHGNIYNQMVLKDYGADNPDQRIGLDIMTMCEETLRLFSDIVREFGRLGVYAVILWDLSGVQPLTIAGKEYLIPGYLCWLALIYAVLVTWLVHKVAHPLTGVQNERQTREADFRFQLIRIRENSESIALLGGDKREGFVAAGLFQQIWDNFMRYVTYMWRLRAVGMGISRVEFYLPYVFAVPAYASGAITFGGLMQVRGAFGNMTTTLKWFAAHYSRLTEWKASVDRVLLLDKSLTEARHDLESNGFSIAPAAGDRLAVSDVNLFLPTGRQLLKDCSFELEKGVHTLITGSSGAGKSTLFRMIAGLWVWGDGHIRYPEGDIMFVPQRPYLPEGSLRAAICYPQPEDTYADSEIIEAMELCCFEKFASRLDQEENWGRVLSGGEQQRVALIRALLEKPDWLFLDEASAALDPDTEATLYAALKKKLPTTTIISIAHRVSLRDYHDQCLDLDPVGQTVSIVPINKALGGV